MTQTLEQKRAWYARNRERLLIAQRARYAANPEKMREDARVRYAANPEPAREYAKRWRTDNWALARLQIKAQQARDIHKRRARGTLKKAVHDGRVVKPTICSVCTVDFGDKKFIHGHHMDYSLQLEVVWVCARCHPQLHH